MHDFRHDTPGLRWPIQRIQQGKCTPSSTPVVPEEPLEIIVNGYSIAVLMRLPGQEKELAAGFSISEGYVRRIEDIWLIHHCDRRCDPQPPAPGESTDGDPAESRNRIILRVAEPGFSPPECPDVIRLIRSGCGGADVSALGETLPLLARDLIVQSATLLELGKKMRARQIIHRQTGGAHAAALFDPLGDPLVVAEDIGRHNAIDKAIGSCLLGNKALQETILVTSGRASYEMAAKAIRVGIPIAATISAPTSLAIRLAQDRGLTLIGYLRGGRMNVYTHAQRIRV